MNRNIYMMLDRYDIENQMNKDMYLYIKLNIYLNSKLD